MASSSEDKNKHPADHMEESATSLCVEDIFQTPQSMSETKTLPKKVKTKKLKERDDNKKKSRKDRPTSIMSNQTETSAKEDKKMEHTTGPLEESATSLNAEDKFQASESNIQMNESQSKLKKKKNKERNGIKKKPKKEKATKTTANKPHELDTSAKEDKMERSKEHEGIKEVAESVTDQSGIRKGKKVDKKKKKYRKIAQGDGSSSLLEMEKPNSSKTSKEKKVKTQVRAKIKLQNNKITVDPHQGFTQIMGDWRTREEKARFTTKKEIDTVSAKTTDGSKRDCRAKLLGIYSNLDLNDKFCPPIFEKTTSEKKLIHESFDDNFAFSDLTPSELKPMLDAFEKVEYKKGDTIAKQGKPDRFFYIIKDGEVGFNVDGDRVAGGGAGDIFGQLALVYSCDRATTATAEEDQTALLRLHQSNFVHIRRHQIAHSIGTRMALLKSVPLFKEVEETDLIQLSAAMTAHVFKADDNLSTCFRNSPFCLIQHGSVTSFADGSISGPGAAFGEDNMSLKGEVIPKILALTDGVAYTIDRQNFEKVFGDLNRLILKSQDKHILRGIRAIKRAKLSGAQLDTLARQISDKPFVAGENVFVNNETMTPSLYIVRKGKVKIVRKNGKEEVIETGGHFGHEYFIVSSKGSGDSVPTQVKAKYNATFIEDSVCGILTLQECASVIGNEDLDVDLDQGKLIKLEMLKKHRVLGEGQFGIVWLVTNTKAIKPEPYALKIQLLYEEENMSHEEEKEARDKIMEEISMMRKLQQPFIVELINIYEEEDNISMLLSLAPGGELFDRIHYQLPNSSLWESGIGEEQGKFYSAVVSDALSFMHVRGYVYRDLKPENVLIGADGYPLITDFGFTKHLKANEQTFTVCGTPNYLPPEILKNDGHGASADNWSLGILIYEVVHGENPFWYDGLDQVSLFQAICSERYYPLPKNTYSDDFGDLIHRLLEKNPSKRLGTFREKDILAHPWFADIRLPEIRMKHTKAPWKPRPVELNLD